MSVAGARRKRRPWRQLHEEAPRITLSACIEEYRHALEHRLVLFSRNSTSKAMSKEQLTALLAKLQHDAGLRAKLKGAGDLDAVVALGREAGFDVSKADFLKFQAEQTLQLSDAELEGVGGGKGDFDTHMDAAHGCWTAKGGPTGCLWYGCKE